jgi:DNA (cytosine-5)-methyltransferase 1
MKNIKYIDLFAGIGGFHQAMSSFGAECVFVSEWDKKCQDVYRKNYNMDVYGDITKIDEKDIPPHDVICAGFPCQAFSVSGKQLGFQDTRGTLFFDVARIAKHHKPKVLLLENVKNFAKHDSGNTLKVVESTLQDLGYSVYHKVLNASNFGVPQKRERVYIVAFRGDLNIDNFQFPITYGKPTKLKDCLLDSKEVLDCIVTRDDVVLKNDVKIEKDEFGNFSQKSIRLGIVNKGGQGERIYSPLGHAITLSAYGGGAGAKTGLYLIDGVIRKLAPRECARITGFPDSFTVDPNKNSAYKQFGNSVVVNVLKSIVENIIKSKCFDEESETHSRFKKAS